MSNSTHPALDDPNAFVLYRYHPSLVAALIFVIAFSVGTLIHLYLFIRHKTWFFTPFIIGAIFECLGYAGRALSSHNQWNLSPFIMQSLLLLGAPPLFSASIYMILGRIIRLLGADDLSVVRPARITKFFVIGDTISFIAQMGGGGLMAMHNLFKTGQKVVLVGLFIQLLFFSFFLFVTGRFHFLFVKSGRDRQAAFPWLKHVANLYAVSAAILIRSIFRVVEYLQGNDGFLMRSEVFVYVFDGLLMFLVVALLILVHPHEISQYIMEKERTSARGTELVESGEFERLRGA